MKAQVVQIAWHQAQSITSVDFCPTIPNKFATSGLDACVRLWSISTCCSESQHEDIPEITFISTLAAHLAGVNIIRWAPNGTCIASADNVGSIVLWKQQLTTTSNNNNISHKSMHVDEDPDTYLEHWSALRVLTGHRDEINDLAWSPCGLYIASVGTDQKVRVWDVACGDIIGSAHHHTDLVQGIAWDPIGQFIVTQSIDRTVNIYKITISTLNQATQQRVAVLDLVHTLNKFNMTDASGKSRAYKLFSDPACLPTSFFRRPSFSPDGSVLVCPSGNVPLTKESNGVHVFRRNSFTTPIMMHTGLQSPAWVTRFSPVLLHPTGEDRLLANCPYRLLYAIGTDESILVYDTCSHYPRLLVQNLHVYRYQDLAFSVDGQFLIAASHDGYCSVVCFEQQCHGLYEFGRRADPQPSPLVPAKLVPGTTSTASGGGTVTLSPSPEPKAEPEPEPNPEPKPEPKPTVVGNNKKRITPTFIAPIPQL